MLTEPESTISIQTNQKQSPLAPKKSSGRTHLHSKLTSSENVRFLVSSITRSTRKNQKENLDINQNFNDFKFPSKFSTTRGKKDTLFSKSKHREGHIQVISKFFTQRKGQKKLLPKEGQSSLQHCCTLDFLKLQDPVHPVLKHEE